MTIHEILTSPYSPPKKYGKRIFDIIFSCFVLIFGAPIYLFLFLLIKLTSKGPVFYKGLRMGQNGKLIYCWKFRSMCINAEEQLETILKQNHHLHEEWKTYHKLKHDPRLIKIGKFLRKTSLDELPQFWNVLKGELSIVGPRPIEIRTPHLAKEEIREKYHGKTDKILSTKPGLTCIWQTRGRNCLTFEKRAELEEEYVDTQSFWLDLSIILKTIYNLLIPKGAC